MESHFAKRRLFFAIQINCPCSTRVIAKKEDRWITLGIDNTGILRVVVHTFEQIDENLWQIRIISARKADHDETKKYNEMTA
ncbi:MAG: BrnT family toxin [Chloroflexota bacterium]